MSQLAPRSRFPAARAAARKEDAHPLENQTLANDTAPAMRSHAGGRAHGSAGAIHSATSRYAKDGSSGNMNHHHHHGKTSDEEEEERKQILANRYKTKMCKNFVATGTCPYEERCMFAHGEAELRTAEQNIADGLTSEEAIKAFKRRQNLNGNHHHTHSGPAQGGRFSSFRPHAQSSMYAPRRHMQSPALAPFPAATAASSVEMDGQEPDIVAGDYNEEAMVDHGFNGHYFIERYTHNPYCLDLLAPQDRHYTAPLRTDAMQFAESTYVDDFAMGSYFPTEEVPSFEDSVTQPSMLTASATSGSKTVGCTAEKVPVMDHEAEREMILEP